MSLISDTSWVFLVNNIALIAFLNWHMVLEVKPEEAISMPTRLKRMTFVVTQEMQPILNRTKKELFYDRTQSDMIRELVIAGLNAIDEKTADRES